LKKREKYLQKILDKLKKLNSKIPEKRLKTFKELQKSLKNLQETLKITKYLQKINSQKSLQKKAVKNYFCFILIEIQIYKKCQIYCLFQPIN
jgi:hypothetical protein